MTIVELHRFAIVGRLTDRGALIDALQSLGCTHVEPGSGGADPGDVELGRPPKQVSDALRVLLATRPRRRQVLDDEAFDLDSVVAEVNTIERQRLRLQDEFDALDSRIADLEPWGDFRLPEPDELGELRLWFYVMPLLKLRALEEVELPWQVVHRDGRRAWVVVIAADEPPARSMPVPRTRTGAVSLAELRRRREAVAFEIEELQVRKQGLTRWVSLMARNVARAADIAAAKAAHAACETVDDDGLFVLHGYVPSRELDELEGVAARSGAAVIAAEPDRGETAPTLLDNPRAWGGGEEMVRFYQTPGYHDWDPSPVVAFSFAVFFAMITADAGYSLLLALGLLWGWRRLGRSELGARLRVLFTWMLAFGVVYGAIVGSWFGIVPPPGSTLGRLHVLQLDDFDSMMRVSVLVGCAHLTLANAIVAWRSRPWPRAMPSVGWILGIAGGVCLWLGQGTELFVWGQGLVIAGLALVVSFAGDRVIRRPLDALKRLLVGLQALTATTRLFGDVLSYLRLFALGLASSSLAMTFNSMAGDIRESVPGLGFLLGLLLLLLGHAINLALALIGGLVHGLRLNFIEFYQWGLGEEGRPFRPFARKDVER